MAREHVRPVHCLFCGGALIVTSFTCTSCGTRTEGRFLTGGPFAAMPREQQAFAALFLLSSGNIKRVGQKLGISYPTVKARLSEVQRNLRQLMEPEKETAEGAERVGEASEVGGTPASCVLDALDRGEVDVESALRLLRGAAPSEEEDRG